VKQWVYHTSLIFILSLCFQPNQTLAQELDDEAIELYPSFRHRSVINTVVISYYKNETFYLPIGELFNLLQIDFNTEVNENNIILNGKYLKEETPYSIDLTDFKASIGNKEIQFTKDDLIIGDLDYYLTPRIFEELFQLNFEMDLNNLALTLESVLTLPVVEALLRKQKRSRIQNNLPVDKNYEIASNRNRQILNGGFLDYNFSQAYNKDFSVFTYNSAIGVEFLGGDVQGSLLGSVSGEYNSFETDNLRWRYTIRNNDYISKITVGQTRSDGILTSSYKGIRITNEPIEPQRIFDEYRITGNTFPESEVELYLNNSLVNFQQTDGIGDYNFLVPLTYGSSNYKLRIYGPTGQIREIGKNIQIPFSFTAPGRVDYHFNVGQQDFAQIGTTDRKYLVNGDVSAGINSWLSTKVGVEYFEELTDSPTYKASISSRLFTNYLLTSEYASNAFFRTTAGVVYANSASWNFTYTDFYDETSVYNLSGDDKQLNGGVFLPFNLFSIPTSLRFSAFSRLRKSVNNTRIRIDASFRKKGFGTRFSYSDNYLGNVNVLEPTLLSEIQNSYTYTISKTSSFPPFMRGMFLRTQFTFLPKMNEFDSAEFLVSRNIFDAGRIQFLVAQNFMNNFTSIGLNLVIDFDKIRTNTSARTVRNSTNIIQNVRGSVGFDNNNNNFVLTSRQQVGKAATAFRLFVDNNANDIFDEGDNIIPENAIRIDRSGSKPYSKNGISYYTQLQPYFKYNLEVNEAAIKNPMLVPKIDKFAIVTDPNQFKPIDIPFYMSGVIDGKVERTIILGEPKRGVSGLKLIMQGVNSDFVKEIRTFSDGSYYAFEVPPGKYTISVDNNQLDILDAKPSPSKLEFEVKALPEGDFVEGLNILLVPKDLDRDSLEQIPTDAIIANISQTVEVQELRSEYNSNLDNTLRYIILAQTAFYNGNISEAMSLVDQSLALFKTAQAFALKGSLNYLLGNKAEAQKNWERATELNPNILIPDIEALDQIIKTQPGD
jgi:hypothetical protein